MTKIILIIIALISCQVVLAHSGRTDASGGHNCSQKSQNKGLCYGYHYHNNVTTLKPRELAAWTGRKERLKDGNGNLTWRCEYQKGYSNKFWIVSRNSCPATL